MRSSVSSLFKGPIYNHFAKHSRLYTAGGLGTGLAAFLHILAKKPEMTDNKKEESQDSSSSGGSGPPKVPPSEMKNGMYSPFESVLLQFPELPAYQYSKSLVYYTPARLQIRTTVFQIHFMYLGGAISLCVALNRFKKWLGLIAIPLWAAFQYSDIMNTAKVITDIILHDDKSTVTIHYGVLLNRQVTTEVKNIKYLGAALQDNNRMFVISARSPSGGATELYFPEINRVVPESMLSGFESWTLVNHILRGHHDEVAKYQKVTRSPVSKR